MPSSSFTSDDDEFDYEEEDEEDTMNQQFEEAPPVPDVGMDSPDGGSLRFQMQLPNAAAAGETSPREEKAGPVGLKNPQGQTCYMSAILQNLVHGERIHGQYTRQSGRCLWSAAISFLTRCLDEITEVILRANAVRGSMLSKLQQMFKQLDSNEACDPRKQLLEISMLSCSQIGLCDIYLWVVLEF